MDHAFAFAFAFAFAAPFKKNGKAFNLTCSSSTPLVSCQCKPYGTPWDEYEDLHLQDHWMLVTNV